MSLLEKDTLINDLHETVKFQQSQYEELYSRSQSDSRRTIVRAAAENLAAIAAVKRECKTQLYTEEQGQYDHATFLSDCGGSFSTLIIEILATAEGLVGGGARSTEQERRTLAFIVATCLELLLGAMFKWNYTVTFMLFLMNHAGDRNLIVNSFGSYGVGSLGSIQAILGHLKPVVGLAKAMVAPACQLLLNQVEGHDNTAGCFGYNPTASRNTSQDRAIATIRHTFVFNSPIYLLGDVNNRPDPGKLLNADLSVLELDDVDNGARRVWELTAANIAVEFLRQHANERGEIDFSPLGKGKTRPAVVNKTKSRAAMEPSVASDTYTGFNCSSTNSSTSAHAEPGLTATNTPTVVIQGNSLVHRNPAEAAVLLDLYEDSLTRYNLFIYEYCV